MGEKRTITVANVMEKKGRNTGKPFWVIVDPMGQEYLSWTSAFVGLVGSAVEIDVTQGARGMNATLVAVQRQGAAPQGSADFPAEKSPYLVAQDAQRLDKISSMSMAYAKDIVVALIHNELVKSTDDVSPILAKYYLEIKNQLEIQAELTD